MYSMYSLNRDINREGLCVYKVLFLDSYISALYKFS